MNQANSATPIWAPVSGSSIAKEIRQQINDAMNGRGPYVLGIDSDTVQYRIIDVRVHNGIVQGKALSFRPKGAWFALAGYKTF